MFFSYIALYKHMTPLGVASLESRGLISRIYVGDHYTLLYTKYISCGPQCFREEDFLSFSHYKSMGGGCGWLGPKGLDWQDLCRRPLNIATH